MEQALLPENFKGEFITECLKSIRNIGSTTYVDVCDNGARQIVEWGSFDWTFLGIVGLLIVGLVIALIKAD